MERVSLAAATHRWFLVGGWAFMVGALFFGLGVFDSFQIGRLDERFQQQARTVEGTVLAKTTTASGSIDILRRQFSSRSYQVTYRFSTPEGQAVEGSATLYSDTWEGLMEGQPIQVRYLPDEPMTNRVDGRTDFGSAAARVLMGGLLAIGGGGLVIWDLGRSLRRKTEAQLASI